MLAVWFASIDLEKPSEWEAIEAIVVPTYKKDAWSDPRSYCPINFINVVSKLYARHFWTNLENCVSLAEEEAGLHSGRATIDHCFCNI